MKPLYESLCDAIYNQTLEQKKANYEQLALAYVKITGERHTSNMCKKAHRKANNAWIAIQNHKTVQSLFT